MIVEVRPLQTTKWHGKIGAESFTRPKKIGALVDGQSLTYATGLTEKEVEEYSAYFKTDLGNTYDPNEPHVFWDSPRGLVKLENNTMFFNDKQIINKVKIKVMKASKYVANSMKEWEEGLWPEAHHVIFDENEQVESRAGKIALRQKAILEQLNYPKQENFRLYLLVQEKI